MSQRTDRSTLIWNLFYDPATPQAVKKSWLKLAEQATVESKQGNGLGPKQARRPSDALMLASALQMCTPQHGINCDRFKVGVGQMPDVSICTCGLTSALRLAEEVMRREGK